ncbi:hypothetical protein [Archangium sp.]|nr:hypothetical protein [Archangium sp.]HYO52484.1 hypothetical protein [Archangium sp.]
MSNTAALRELLVTLGEAVGSHAFLEGEYSAACPLSLVTRTSPE